MQIPFIILSYDQFARTKKIFSYEKDGVHILPIFTDASRAMKFASTMTETLNREFGDKRTLQTQICSDPKMALSMFQTITAYCPDLLRLIIDPIMVMRDEEGVADLESLAWVETFQDIDDAMEQIQDWVSSETEAMKGDSNTP